jgi:SAM-dependent methyltransferase
MHIESYQIMKYFVKNFLDIKEEYKILDIGSFDVSGSYKNLFINKNWQYIGLDIIPGPNVDIVAKGPYDFGLVKKFDIVISGNCLEHVEAPWLWIKEVEKVIKPGGLLCIIMPFNLGEHRFPVDCYRILPDGFKYLLCTHCDFELIESKISNPQAKIRFFSSRPYLLFLYNILPQKVKNALTKSPDFVDSYAIARKN